MTIPLISIGLAMDALAVSLGIGTAGQIPSLRGKLRLAAHFGIFQSLMTGLGWLAGETIIQFVKVSIIGSHLRCWDMLGSI